MPTTFEVLYLGNVPEIDTIEGNETAEGDGSLVGMTFGSAGSPLAYNAQATMSVVDISGDETDRYDINNDTASDTFSIDGGPARVFDGLAVYNATLTYVDGSTASISAVVFQDNSGDLFLAPEGSANADATAMAAAPIRSLTLDSIVPIAVGNLLANRQATDFLCFAAETPIRTDRGCRSARSLRPGMLVWTLDHGLVPLQSVLDSRQSLFGLPRDARPVLIASGALGYGKPSRDLIVSPQHRILVGSPEQLSWLLPDPHLVPAKALTDLPGIRHMIGRRDIHWVHLRCTQHEIIDAAGVLAETLYVGDYASRRHALQPTGTPPARPLLRPAIARRRFNLAPVLH